MGRALWALAKAAHARREVLAHTGFTAPPV